MPICCEYKNCRHDRAWALQVICFLYRKSEKGKEVCQVRLKPLKPLKPSPKYHGKLLKGSVESGLPWTLSRYQDVRALPRFCKPWAYSLGGKHALTTASPQSYSLLTC